MEGAHHISKLWLSNGLICSFNFKVVSGFNKLAGLGYGKKMIFVEVCGHTDDLFAFAKDLGWLMTRGQN